MGTVSDIVSGLAERTRPENAPSWDPVGLQLGDLEAPVSSIAVCHEVTEEVVANLEPKPVDLLVTYHPLLFHPTRRLIAGRSSEARAYRLVRAGVNLLVTHTDFDAAPGGAADSLATLFDLRHVEPFGEDEESGMPAIGRVGTFEASLAALDAIATDAFGPAGLRVSGNRDRHLERVAVVPGAGSDLIEQAAAVADGMVTGDVTHHRAVRALDMGLCVLDPGHIATERPGARALVDMVGEASGLEVRDLTSLDPQTWG